MFVLIKCDVEYNVNAFVIKFLANFNAKFCKTCDRMRVVCGES